VENPALLNKLIRYQRDHDDLACLCHEVAVSGGGVTDSSTRVAAVMRAWVPRVMPCVV
jgi:hypothetical protein